MNHEKQEILIDSNSELLLIKTGESITVEEVKQSWQKLQKALVNPPRRVEVDCSRLKSADNSGKALLVYIEKTSLEKGADFRLNSLSDELKTELEAFRTKPENNEKTNLLRTLMENIGGSSVGLIEAAKSNITFIGRVSVGFGQFIKNPSSLRWKDTFVISELAGVNSFWICATIGVLFGLILAFQSAMPMRQFGAEIYVASLVSMSLFRVLGPFIAAILFAARSGSAFAAEIGTMKVNEELDALVTMGLDPVRFLTIPRVLTGFIFVPMLAVVVNLFGLAGMFAVMLSLDYPFKVIYDQVIAFTTFADMAGGIFKSFVFGILVAGVGCLRGLQTTTGSQAVGQAATKAVVSGIVLVVIAEGIFSVIFYLLEI